MNKQLREVAVGKRHLLMA